MSNTTNPFIYRSFLSLLIIYGLREKIHHIPVLIGIIILTDFIDTNIHKSIADNMEYAKTVEYQNNDKIVDVLTYYLVLATYRHLFDQQTYIILWAALIYRSYGVYSYHYSQDRNEFSKYPDLLKEIMIVYFLSKKFKIIHEYYLFFVTVAIFLKIQFERWHHTFDYVGVFKKFLK